MITEQKIKIYQKYGGDIDGFSRGGRKKEKLLFENSEWSLIDSILQDLEMIKEGLCSIDFKERCEKLVHDNFDSGAIELIKKIV